MAIGSEAVVVRRARRADARRIVELARELAAHVHDPPPSTTAEDLQSLCFGPARWCDCVVATLDRRVVGYAMYSRVFEAATGDRRLVLGDLIVSERFRGRGIGRALMIRVIRAARRLACGRLTWEVWKHNETALRFYSEHYTAEIDDVVVMVTRKSDFERLLHAATGGPPGRRVTARRRRESVPGSTVRQ